MDIEASYLEFCEKHPELLDYTDIDFFGINVSEKRSNAITFKLYMTTEVSRDVTLELLRPLYERDMISALNLVNDNVNINKLRCDVGLKNRTNDNMMFLFDWLRNGIKEKDQLNEIEEFSKIKCSDDNDLKYASMYFLGLIADKNDRSAFDAVKLHYILRRISDANRIGENYSADNRRTIKELKRVELPWIQRILSVLEPLLDKGLAELWIAAADYYVGVDNKYKIYVKNINEAFYDRIYIELQALDSNISDHLKMSVDWIKSHREYTVYGMAICLSESYNWSLNFYLDRKEIASEDVKYGINKDT